jgi:hypothetical protein
MIVTEFMTINGKAFVRTYSDSALMVERDGVRYVEAIDPAEFGRVYTETDEPIEHGMTEIEEKAKAYDVIMGVAK